MAANHTDDGLRQQIEAQINEYQENVSKFFDSGNKSTIYVPEHRKICHYLKAQRKYEY